jgi:hypothetical protein
MALPPQRRVDRLADVDTHSGVGVRAERQPIVGEGYPGPGGRPPPVVRVMCASSMLLTDVSSFRKPYFATNFPSSVIVTPSVDG